MISKIRNSNIYRFFSILPLKIKVKYLLLGVLFSLGFIVEFFSPIIQKSFIDIAIAEKDVFNFHFYQLVSLYVIVAVSSIIISIGLSNLKVSINKIYFFKYLVNVLTLNKTQIKKQGTGYYYDLISKDVENASGVINLSWFSFLFSLIQVIGIFYIVFSWSKILFLIFILSFFSSMIFSIFFNIMNQKNFSKMRKYASSMAHETIESISNNFTIKTFLVLNNFIKNIETKYIEFEKYLRKYIILSYAPESLSAVFHILAYLAMIIYSLFLLIEGDFSYGNLIAIIAYFELVSKPASYFENLVNKVAESDISIQRLSNLNYKKILPKNNDAFNSLNFDNFFFDKVVFLYEKLNTSLSIDYKFKDKTSIVGLSGAGKTTIIDILLREKMPKEGNIYVNDQDIQSFHNQVYFSRLNILSQDLEIFDKDIIFNLTLGRKLIRERNIEFYKNNIREIFSLLLNEETLNSSKIIRDYDYIRNKIIFLMNDFDESQLNNFKDSFIKSNEFQIRISEMLFNQLYVISERISKMIKELELSSLRGRKLGENGNNVSGGEKHKIALCRFFTKEFFDFFILDEPFMNLDLFSEKKLIELTKKYLQNVNGILVSHKLNIIESLTNEVIIFNNGKIEEKGKISELKKSENLYRRLIKESKSNFKDLHGE